MTMNLMAFVDNLYYMAVGMTGVFLVIGVIIAATCVLLRVGANEKA
ncbi:MAG: hypothetical protein PHC80_00765 [Eubacteriales bacterium]|nr:hypothetical protein [Eubacteriales bacterium]